MTTVQPTAMLVLMGSAIAYDEKGEVLETYWNDDGTPDWDSASICDPRGGAGQAGFDALRTALDACELNARLMGEEIVRVPSS